MKKHALLFMDSIIDLIFPVECAYCKRPIRKEESLCLQCSNICLQTDHFQIIKNGLFQRIQLRIKVKHGAALYYYIKSGVVQKAVHKIKYSGRKDLAIKFGKEFAGKYLNSKHFSKADYILPIPLHKKRKRKRTYNQSEEFAKGIREITKIEILNSVLLKIENHKSLTKQTRESRFDQVKRSFVLNNKELIFEKTILLVDDVITTGATLEAAAEVLMEAKCRELQIGVIAIAYN